VAAYITEESKEKVILVGVSTDTSDMDIRESLDELKELCETAGAEVVGELIQNRERVDSKTYIGKGKIDELKALVEMYDATGVVCDDELTPAQQSNLTDAMNKKVMDRTLIILDIFAARAITGEGKLQVELAQLRYRATRLTGFGRDLSRLGGGIGTRGPGEKKLEIDKRVIKNRISILKSDLSDMKKHRELLRENRTKSNIPLIAIVGYTNAGKSTLLNSLTNAGILEEDMLFATLDPTTREYVMEGGQKILLTDTVGFIRKLPHHLVEAFKSTLEEAKYADILIHVVDSSNERMESQIETVYKTLDMLGAGDKPVITVFNKIDKLEGPKKNKIDWEIIAEDRNVITEDQGTVAENNVSISEDRIFKDSRAKYIVNASVKKNINVDKILNAVEEELRENKTYISKVFSYDEAGKIAVIRKYGELITEEYRNEGIYVEAFIPKNISI